MTEDPAYAELSQINYASLSTVAAKAVCDLWNATVATFARSTIESPDGLRPTVTFRCTEILIAAQHEARDLLRDHHETIDAAAAVVAETTPREAEERSSLKYPAYTIALLTLANARVGRLDTDSGRRAGENVDGMVNTLITTLNDVGSDDAHPFVQEHALRAFRAAYPFVSDTAPLDAATSVLIDAVRVSTQDLLAKHHMALLTPAESVVLAFCAAALSTTQNARDDKFALAALTAAATAQDASGSWPLGRVVRDDPGRLEISTYEVAWVTAATLETLLDRNVCSVLDRQAATIVEAVARAGRYAARSIVETEGGVRGWASDHPYQQPRVESWTSAIVLQFVLASADLRDDVRNRRVLASFSSLSPRDETWPSWLTWDAIHERSEPDKDHPVFAYLEDHVITPIEADPRRLPSGNRECASVLLFGPPGTAKTTIVKAVAQRLDWPIVFLSPGTFIEQGLEAIEATARSVFDRLQQLRRAVVIFDECDELFRGRQPSDSPDQLRNISAFVTASMLPKLQDLHDRGQVLVFICTNHVGTMDSAVLRGGRMDHRVGVGPPDGRARGFILREAREHLPADIAHLDSALKELGRLGSRFSRNELKRAAAKLVKQAQREPWTSVTEAQAAADALVKSMSDSLTITDDLMKRFEKDQKKWSDPFLLGAE